MEQDPKTQSKKRIKVNIVESFINKIDQSFDHIPQPTEPTSPPSIDLEKIYKQFKMDSHDQNATTEASKRSI